jgi:hypothetical protein
MRAAMVPEIAALCADVGSPLGWVFVILVKPLDHQLALLVLTHAAKGGARDAEL